MNGSLGEWFRTTVGVREECLLSPILLKHFTRTDHFWYPEITCYKGKHRRQKYYQSAVADDIDTVADEEKELEALVESLDKTCAMYKMKIGAKLKTKLMTNSANGIQREIKVKGQKLGPVTSFKYP